MSGPIQELTLNYQFEIPAFDFPNWHTYYARTLRTMDALFLLSTGISFMRGPWANNKVYAVGDVVVDMDVATAPNIYQALVAHTSALTGTFAADRTARPTFWQSRLSLPQFRGTWVTATSYTVGDFIVSGQQYAVAKANHTSGATFAGDAANWSILIDLGGAVFTTGIKLAGATSGNTTIIAAAVASGTLTAPSATDTLVGRATTDTLTNKTLTAPALTSPVITGLFTAAGLVTNAALAAMPTATIKGNSAGGTAIPADLTIPQVTALLSAPQVSVFNTGTAATYTTPANAKYIVVEIVGGGGGGAGGGTTPGAATGGANTTFSTLTAGGGGLGRVDGGVAAGGTATGGDVNFDGQDGAALYQGAVNNPGSPGGASIFGGSGPVSGAGIAGNSAKANTGSGGGGGGSGASTFPGGGGAAGGYCRKLITAPSATYTYTVGAGGAAGTAGTNGAAGGAGSAGKIIVTAYFQ